MATEIGKGKNGIQGRFKMHWRKLSTTFCCVAGCFLFSVGITTAQDDVANWRQPPGSISWVVTTGKMPKGAELRIKVIESSGRNFLNVGKGTDRSFTKEKQYSDPRADDIIKWTVPEDTIVGIGGPHLKSIEKKDGYQRMHFENTAGKLIVHVKIVGGF